MWIWAGWTGPVILTAITAVVALFMSGLTLGWQIHSWRRSGPRVKVERIQGIDGDNLFIGVEATNSGRLGTQVLEFGFALPGGDKITAPQDFRGTPIKYPFELPPGGKASVRYLTTEIVVATKGHRVAEKARPFALTGHGRFEGKAINLGYEVRHSSRSER